MDSITNFKNFVRKNPSLISYVKENRMTWQKFYELYDLYGEDHEIWNEYKDIKTEKNTDTKTDKSHFWSDIVNMTKNLDVDKVQNGISSLQKTLGLIGDLFVNKNTSDSNSSYQPRPVYKKFED